MRSFLLISPHFPPMSRSGAKRPLHFVRHLPSHGWRPIVLAAPPVEDATDPRMGEAVPADTAVYRWFAGPSRARRALLRRLGGIDPAAGDGAPRGERSLASVRWAARARRILGERAERLKLNAYFTPFDRYLWDLPAGTLAGAVLARTYGVDAVYACGDPFTCFYAGVALKKLLRRPLVLDLRDPWALHDGKMALRPSPTASAVHALERGCFQAADKVILNTEAALARYQEHYRGVLPEDRFTAIRNSFDPTLFDDYRPEPFSRFTVLYFGTLRRFVRLDEFFEGFRRFIDRARLSPAEARFVVVGGLGDEDRATARAHGVGDYVHSLPTISLRESMRYLRAADLLLMVVQDSCKLQIPGKLYDYLAAGRPVFAVSANEEANRILAETGAGLAVSGRDPERVAKTLAELYERRHDPAAHRTRTQPYTADAMSAALAGVLDVVTGPHLPPPTCRGRRWRRPIVGAPRDGASVATSGADRR